MLVRHNFFKKRGGMGFYENGLERTAAICVGATSLAFGALPSGALEAGVGLAGIAGFVLGQSQKFGPECARVRNRIRKKIMEDFGAYIKAEGDDWELKAGLKSADKALQECLGECVIDRKKLAASAVTPKGFPEQAVTVIMDGLAAIRPDLFGEGRKEDLPHRYATNVVQAGIEEAAGNAQYYRELEPVLMFEMAKALGQVRQDIAETNQTTKRIEQETNKISETVDALRVDKAREIVRSARSEIGQRPSFERQSLPTQMRNLANEAVSSALLQAPEDPVVLVLSSDLNRWDGDAEKALKYARKAIEGDPTDVSAWIAQGAAQLKLSLGAKSTSNSAVSINADMLNQTLASFEKVIVLDEWNASAHAYRGVTLHYLNSVDEALICLDKAIELDASLSHAYQSKAYVLAKQGDMALAVQTIQFASELFSDDPDVWSYYGWIVGHNDNETALSCYERTLALRPLSPRAWIGKATELGNLGRDAEALAAFERAISLNPNSALSWTNKGWVLEKLDRNEDALLAQEKAVRLEPQFSEAWSNLGATFFNLQRIEEAVDAFEKALELRPEDAFAWCEMALALSKLNRHGDALAALEKSIELDDAQALAWSRISNALADLDRLEDALEAGAKAVDLEPESAVFWFNHGSTLARMNRFSNALEAFERATEFDPEDYQGWQYRSRVLGNLGRFEESLLMAENAIQLNDEEAFSWNLKGRALGELGRLAEAVEFFERACSLDPSNEFFWRNLGLTQMGLSAFSDALESLKRADEINPNDANVKAAMGEAYGNTGNFERAYASFKDAISLGIDNANTWTSAARALGALGRMKDSIEASERALAHDPEHAGAWNNKGMSLEALEQYAEAIECFEEALRCAPQFEMAQRNRDRVIQALGEAD